MKIFIILFVFAFTACSNSRPVYVTATPGVTPLPPVQYAKLPFRIRIDCLREPAARANAIVNELPGLPPEIAPDVIDNYQGSGGPPDGNLGKFIGDLEPCEVVAVSKLEWSSYDKIFYLYIDNGKIHGWIRDEHIEVF